MVRDIPLPEGLKPPSRLATFGELALPLDMLRYSLSGWHLIGAPRGDGRPVVLLPGYGASELSMRPLEAYLRHLGYHVRDWGMGRNNGHVAADVERFAAQAAEWVKADGAPLTLVGWSLGGVIARETARSHPRLVREVITMGTPIIGGPKYTALAQRFAGRDFDAIERDIHARNLRGLTQPLTVIYSDRDGIVSPASRSTSTMRTRETSRSMAHISASASIPRSGGSWRIRWRENNLPLSRWERVAQSWQLAA